MYRGRFAPSPTGPLHIGSLTCALAGFLDARANGGEWLVRIEDIDPPREKRGAAAGILRTLQVHGLAWDGEVLFQHTRLEAYEAALGQLRARDAAFPCPLSRTQLAACGHVHPGRAASLAAGGATGDFAWRLDVQAGETCFDDRIQGRCCIDVAAHEGPFVVRRREGLFAYQLAVVVDDAFQGITDVVRGHDLLDSTPKQWLLQDALGLPHPRYAHHPVIADDSGAKFSKQALAAPVQDDNALANLRLALRALGQDTQPDASRIDDLLAQAVAGWRIDRVPRRASVPLADLLR